MSIPVQPSISILDPMLKLAYSSFDYDQTVLVPARNGQIVSEWKNAGLAHSHSREYQLELARNDIAVACGIPSKGLCAIRFTTKDRLNAFLDSNPALRETLATSSPDGFHLWLRVTNFCPSSCGFTELEWISDGNIIVLTRNSLHQYRIENQGKPISLDFEQLVWPTEAARAFKKDAIGRKYPPTLTDQQGQVMANDNYIAAIYVFENPIFYHPSERQFVYGKGQPTKLCLEMLKLNILDFLELYAGVYRKQGCWMDTSLRHVNQLVELVRVMSVIPPTDEETAVEHFVEAQLTPASGRNVSIEETYTYYAEYCSREKLPVLSKTQFQDRIAGVVMRKYGLGKSHSIKRDNRCVRGFRGLEVRGGQDVGTRDCGDVRDEMDAKMDSSIIYLREFNASTVLS